jgi:Ca-activated chloride channel family protein
MAADFAAQRRKTASGKQIEVKPVLVNSGRQAEVLSQSALRGLLTDTTLEPPTIVTPSVSHWLALTNAQAGRTVVDLGKTEDLAIAWTGLATYKEMAQCLGWPNREIGYDDIQRLRQDPQGWASCPGAKVEWGRTPLMPFSDPLTSSTARSILFGMYATAVGKPADRPLSQTDVADSRAITTVREFQKGVDHYVADTLILQTKMTAGPGYGHLYWIEENTLVQLYQGKASVAAGTGTRTEPLQREMVFIYPKQGSIAHNHPAGLVDAPWVDPEQVDAARQWIAYLREDAQQRAFMQDGFRPATQLAVADPISSKFGLDPAGPKHVLAPPEPDAVASMMDQWGEVKKPGIVTFVVDVSGSMQGKKLDQAKQGVARALDGISKNTSVGFLTFSDSIKTSIPVAAIDANKYRVSEEAQRMVAAGQTGLYDAIAEGVRLTDQAQGADDTIRGVVVLTDGQANVGRLWLQDLVTMSSRQEVAITSFQGRENISDGQDAQGRTVPKKDILGTSLKLKTAHPIHVFFVGVGEADLEIGRILAESTGSAYQGTVENDLAAVLEKFGKYF